MSSIDNAYLFNSGVSSHIYNRIEGKEVDANTATVVQIDEESAVQVSLSKEAQETLAKIDLITEQLRYIEKTVGYNELTLDEQREIQAIATRLDKLHGFNVAQTSESYLNFGSDARINSDDLFKELQTLTAQEELTAAEQGRIEDIVNELNTLFTSGSKYAQHSFNNLTNDQLGEISSLFIELGSATVGLDKNNVSEENLQKAADISVKIDNFFKESGTLNEAKELSTSEKAEVRALLDRLDEMVESQESETLSTKVQQIVAQAQLSYLHIITGKGFNDNNDFVNPLVKNDSGFTSYAAQQAQGIIDAYNANKL